MRGIAIYAVMALFRTRDLVSDLSARLPMLQGLPMCVMLSRFRERQKCSRILNLRCERLLYGVDQLQ